MSSQSYGGSRAVLTGLQHGVSSGRYSATLAALPDAVNGCIPAGTPIYMDDAAKTVAVHYAFDVYEAVSYIQGATSIVFKLTKSFEGSRIQVGMVLGVAPATDITAEVTVGWTVTAVNRTNANYDSVTCSTSATAGGATIAIHTTLLEVADNSGWFVKVLPNAFTFYDVVKHPDAAFLTIDGLFCQADGVLLTRRVPPIATCVRTYLAGAGNVYMRYSASQE